MRKEIKPDNIQAYNYQQMKRRNFIKTSLTVGAALAVPDFLTELVYTILQILSLTLFEKIPILLALSTSTTTPVSRPTKSPMFTRLLNRTVVRLNN
jgi:hypothetical protein